MSRFGWGMTPEIPKIGSLGGHLYYSILCCYVGQCPEEFFYPPSVNIITFRAIPVVIWSSHHVCRIENTAP